MVDFKAIEQKWKKYWEENKTFESSPNPGQKKFFLTFPYPYMNGYAHVGHFYSIMRTEVFARYKRLQGFNVLYPQAWHCTGSPIESVAKRIREGEETQLNMMEQQGFSKEQVEKFGDPTYWTEFFPNAWKADFQNLGLSIDWRRSFITTDLNPHYNKFIEWQFRKLKEKNYVVKGKHPVVWDPKENTPVGDHDRKEGEGETPQEFVLVKHKLDDGRYVVSATLRPDTILGMTNLYVHPDFEYKEVEVDKETWIIGQAAVDRLTEQDRNPVVKGAVKGTDLIGQEVDELDGDRIMILPATFLDEKFGTGLVHSCPSDSADDLIALQDLQRDEGTTKKYKLDIEKVRAIKPKPVLVTGELGEIPAQALLDKYKVKNQNDKKKLDTIKKELYKLSFHTAVFNAKYKDFFSKNLEGVKVAEGKEFVKRELLAGPWADHYYQLTGRVIARSLAECVVKIVDNQWFMNYSDDEWKAIAHECLDQMKLYPEKSRQQFDYVLDWLQNWACVREFGLGTRLPWAQEWKIEALSDSTIYMAYYTIAHKIKDIPVDNIDDEFFDYVFLGKGNGNGKIDSAQQLKEEFDYWYPLDFRNSGKDLIQNHLSFSIFNHVGIFPKEKWPQGFGVNGWVTVDGAKMSKSAGNFIMLKDLAHDYPVDSARLTIMSGGEGMDDPNWDSEFAKATGAKLNQLHELCATYYGKGREDKKNVDQWMESQLNLLIKETTHDMEQTMFRSALQHSFFDLPRITKQYLKKTDNNPSKEIMDKVIQAQVIMLAPFTPFLSEEIWQILGNDQSVAFAQWPSFDESKIDYKANYLEDLKDTVKKDVLSVMKLAKKESLQKITLFVPPQWKYDVYTKIKEQLKNTRNPGEIIKQLATQFPGQAKELTKLIPRLVKNESLMPSMVLNSEQEFKALEESKSVFEKEFSCPIELISSEESKENKAQLALPGKPAIVVE